VDAFRAVNAVFQAIDHLAARPNVYILATSNLPKAIDRAFFDRADLLFYVDLPNETMRREILSDIIMELNSTVGTRMQLSTAEGDAASQQWATLVRETEGL